MRPELVTADSGEPFPCDHNAARTTSAATHDPRTPPRALRSHNPRKDGCGDYRAHGFYPAPASSAGTPARGADCFRLAPRHDDTRHPVVATRRPLGQEHPNEPSAWPRTEWRHPSRKEISLVQPRVPSTDGVSLPDSGVGSARGHALPKERSTTQAPFVLPLDVRPWRVSHLERSSVSAAAGVGRPTTLRPQCPTGFCDREARGNMLR